MIEVQTYGRLSESYPEIIRCVLEYADEVDMEERGGMTKEFIAYTLCLRDPVHCLVHRPGFSHKFLKTEIVLLHAGWYDEELVRSVTPKAADLLAPATAYGPRIWPQIGYVEEELLEHDKTRRGVVYIGRPDDLSELREGHGAERKGEMPCTEKIQFLVRKDRLHLIVSMRSWDLVWGLCYDVPNFVSLQMAMARALGVGVGYYYHMAGSAHIYKRHWDIVAESRDDGELQLPWLRNDLYSTRNAAQEIVTSMREELDGRESATA